jgi:hypothetical protein
MAKTSRPINAEFVELLCDRCQNGVLRIQAEQSELAWSSSIDIHCAPSLWDMDCHNCRHPVSYSIPGPYLIYKSRKFVLYDSVTDKINALRALLRRTIVDK